MAQPKTYPRLLGDVGGTHARFAWQARAGSTLIDPATYPCAAHPTLQHALHHYLAMHAKPAPRGCAIGIAAPALGDLIQMTNHPWSFSISEVKRELRLDRFVVINDFTALALALPALQKRDLRQVGAGEVVEHAPLGLIGPGTGLGVSGLLVAADGRSRVAINGEGGHVTLAAANELEDEVVRVLRRRFGHASAERAVSGPGLVNLYEAMCELEGVPAQTLAAADVMAKALSEQGRQCSAALDMFFGLLGTVAGNLALSLGARGGIYIGGGIVARLGDRIDRSSFRERFEGKGRFRAYLREIPTFVIDAETSPALIGAARALDDL